MEIDQRKERRVERKYKKVDVPTYDVEPRLNNDTTTAAARAAVGTSRRRLAVCHRKVGFLKTQKEGVTISNPSQVEECPHPFANFAD